MADSQILARQSRLHLVEIFVDATLVRDLFRGETARENMVATPDFVNAPPKLKMVF